MKLENTREPDIYERASPADKYPSLEICLLSFFGLDMVELNLFCADKTGMLHLQTANEGGNVLVRLMNAKNTMEMGVCTGYSPLGHC